MNMYMNEFIRFYCGESANTARSYGDTVQDYCEFCGKTFGWSMEEVINNSNKRSVLLYIAMLSDKQLSPYTINQRISALSTFFKYTIEFEHRTKENPLMGVKKMNVQGIEQKSEYLTEEEYMALIAVTQIKVGRTKKFAFTSARDKFLYTLNLTVGLRVSESLNLKVSQFNEDIIAIVGKGGKLRKFRVTDEVRRAFNEYMNVRYMAYEDTDTVDEGYVFVTINGNQLQTKDVNKNLKKHMERAGIDKDIASHSLRRSCATHYLSEGVPVAQVSKLLGHTNVQTTMRYYKEDGSDFDFLGL